MPAFESGRRLCLLVEAAGTRFAFEATSVVEVSPPGADGTRLRGLLEIRDLSVLLGGAPEDVPGMVVVLDVSPTLALRVRSVVGVADVAPAPFFLLPQGLGDTLAAVCRGVLLHGERLYLELLADALVPPRAPARAPDREVRLLEAAPERSLVFESQGRLFGAPLPLVSQVVPRGEAFCPLPAPGGPVVGLLPHAQALWPVYSVPGLLGAPLAPEPLVVLTEPAGQGVGLAASRALGVHPGLVPADAPGEFGGPGLPDPALFPDLQRMFS